MDAPLDTDQVRPAARHARRLQQSLSSAITDGTTAADAKAYAAVTGKILHKPATRNAGYSKLSSTAPAETDQSQTKHAAKSEAPCLAHPGRKKRERNRRLATKLFNKATCPDWLWTEDRQLKRTLSLLKFRLCLVAHSHLMLLLTMMAATLTVLNSAVRPTLFLTGHILVICG